MKLFVLVAFVISAACAATLSGAKPAHKSIVRYLNPNPNIKENDSRMESRIIGGNNAWDKLLPFQVSLSMGPDSGLISKCGGTLISHEWVLTSAHCLDSNPEYIEIGLGSTQRNNPLKRVYAYEAHIHENWNLNSLASDIALLKFKWVDYNERIAPAALPSRNGQYATYVNEKVTTSGWGAINEEGDDTDDLQYTNLKVVSNDICRWTYGDNGATEDKICTLSYDSSTCPGDWGGPLVLANTRTLIGIDSFGGGCLEGYPMGFTRVTSYLDWINSISGIAS